MCVMCVNVLCIYVDECESLCICLCVCGYLNLCAWVVVRGGGQACRSWVQGQGAWGMNHDQRACEHITDPVVHTTWFEPGAGQLTSPTGAASTGEHRRRDAGQTSWHIMVSVLPCAGNQVQPLAEQYRAIKTMKCGNASCWLGAVPAHTATLTPLTVWCRAACPPG